jgi:putative ABC transport system permease protein
MSVAVEGYQPAPDEDMRFYSNAVTAGYFQAIGTRVLRGRAFEDTDTASSPLVAMINEAAAKKYFAGRDPLGGRLKFDEKNWVQIVGVAEDTKVGSLDESPSPLVYSPFAQDPFGDQVGAVHLLVRTTGDEEALLGPLSEQLRAIDRNAPVYDISTFTWRVRRLVMPQRMGASLFGAFALLALVLAALGIYGVASYMASLRTRELGIRIALGADRARIQTLVLRQGSLPVAAGLAAGLVLAAIASGAVASFLRGVQPRDPITYAAVVVLLAAIALVAIWIPARRAARLDPIQALRQD